MAAWTRRRNTYESTIKKPVFITPTLLKQQEEEMAEAARQETNMFSSRTPSLLVGELAHRFLEGWDFAQDVENFGDRIVPWLDQWLPRIFDRNASKYTPIWQKSWLLL